MKISKYITVFVMTIGMSFAATDISNDRLSYSLGYNLIKSAQASKVLGTNEQINSSAFLDGIKLAIGETNPKLTEKQVKFVSFMMGYMTGMSSVRSTQLINDEPAKQGYNLDTFIKGASDRLQHQKPEYKVLSNKEMKQWVESK